MFKRELQVIELTESQMESARGGNIFLRILNGIILRGERVYAPGLPWFLDDPACRASD
ncbi:MAG TPA: hypothetical protein VFV50_08915 [Bdellovibrionales bacterium]|nr:hypothetical protein [Bdellovibrionales bacterium]